MIWLTANCEIVWTGCWIGANTGLKFDSLFYSLHFDTSVYFKTSAKKIPIDLDKISEEIFPSL